MKDLNNVTLQIFMNKFIKVLEYENRDTKINQLDRGIIDIPFVASSLYQDFKNNENEYTDFVHDLECYGYDIYINPSSNDYNGIIDVVITFFLDYNDGYSIIDVPSHFYEFKFNYDDRLWGYCECTPDMPDYRDDKGCCGHGCDASFCGFELFKILKTHEYSWQGDEHDYWEFEDDFYKNNKEIAKKEEERKRKLEIEECKKYIEKYNKRLLELQGEY